MYKEEGRKGMVCRKEGRHGELINSINPWAGRNLDSLTTVHAKLEATQLRAVLGTHQWLRNPPKGGRVCARQR
jgi:hypothetical protein